MIIEAVGNCKWMTEVELFDERLVVALRLFAARQLSVSQLRAFLADRFFDDAPQGILDRVLTGEIEIALAEYDRDDRQLSYVVEVAAELATKALEAAEKASQVRPQDLARALALA